MNKLLGLIGCLSKVLMSSCFKPIFIVELQPVDFLAHLRNCKSVYFSVREALLEFLEVTFIEIVLEVYMHYFGLWVLKYLWEILSL